jgi:hypothetical protein
MEGCWRRGVGRVQIINYRTGRPVKKGYCNWDLRLRAPLRHGPRREHAPTERRPRDPEVTPP